MTTQHIFNLERLIGLLAPHYCVGCGRPGKILCSECVEAIPLHPQICARCQKLSQNFKICPVCRRHLPINNVFIATDYEGVIEKAIHRLKFGRAAAAARDLSPLINHKLVGVGYDLVTVVPSTSSRLRIRGYNPAQLVARQVARSLSLSFKSLLTRHGQSHQVGARRHQRLSQVKGVFSVANTKDVKNRRVLLIDDVVTTGATIGECARVLKSAGAKSVSAAVLARHNFSTGSSQTSTD